LGGGAALELYTGDFHKIKDWDIFSQSIKVVDLLAKKLKDLGFENTKYTEWGETFEKSGVIVQLITKYYAPDPQYLFDAFDLSTCCFASNGRYLYYTAQASEDVAEKKISCVRSKNPISAIKRIARYGQKGYMPTTQAIREVLKLETGDFDFDEEEDYES
jgi:hypothetical protein